MSTATPPAASQPPVVLVIGMAGSGKTTFMQRLNAHLHSEHTPPYVLNLDPAVLKVPYTANIDIRDLIKYRKVMEEYNLGPNGAIVTLLNLFATKIDQVVGLMEKRAAAHQHMIVDTPGQIECFIWSASGAIITEAFALEFPTVVAYVVDTPRNTLPTTFMLNMLYACSILYKTRLPMVLVFNKTDVQDAEFAKEWMADFEVFQQAMEAQAADDSTGYMQLLVGLMALMLEEFYAHLDVCAVSAYTGDGFDEFVEAVGRKATEFQEVYVPEREARVRAKEEKEAARKQKLVERLMKDLLVEGEAPVVLDDEWQGEVERDEDGGREYNFPEDRTDVEGGRDDADLQKRYREAAESVGRVAQNLVEEQMMEYLRR